MAPNSWYEVPNSHMSNVCPGIAGNPRQFTTVVHNPGDNCLQDQGPGAGGNTEIRLDDYGEKGNSYQLNG